MTILYHYCSTEAFVSIISNRSIRMSALSLSNDTMEGKIVKSVLMRLAERDGLPSDTSQRIQEIMGRIEGLIEGLGFCLSTEGDLLSQWRGYADNARGLSIGFSKEYIKKVALNHLEETGSILSLEEVKYTAVEHAEQIESTYTEIRLSIENKEEPDRLDNAIITKLVNLSKKLYLLKSDAFKEEREWRLLEHYNSERDGECEYRASFDRIIPYKEVRLERLDTPEIFEVFVGPRHNTPTNAIIDMLNRYGFRDVKVNKSVASYR